jgi:hypothetical protein
MLSWREKQKRFFAESKFEFTQDQRIIDWGKNSSIWMYGDVAYFINKLICVNDINQAEKILIIINTRINVDDLKKLLSDIKSQLASADICLSVNKFLLYSNQNNFTLTDDYDQALNEFVKDIFNNASITYYFVKDLKGKHFNFASPTTQFYISY